jgi:hypothetical protein
MIRRDRNHPCIVMWSMGNETNRAADSKWAAEEDDTRILHARNATGYGKHVTHTDKDMDMENLLRCTIRGWYDKDVKNAEPAECQSTGHEEWQHLNARLGKSLRGQLRMGNGVMWLYEDHGADREYRNCPLKHVNPKGWVDSYRVPKYLYYLWQANYLDKPMVFIHPHFWRASYIGQAKEIRIDSNCERVELKVDGAAVGTLQPSDENLHSVVFKDVPVRRGTLEAVGHKRGQTVRAVLPMAGEPARVTLSASHDKVEAALDSLAIVKADIVDAKGVHVYGATHTLTWSVEGPGRLVGPPVYKSDLHADGAMEGTMYIDAPVCNVIRAAGAPGTITVRVSADGLAAGTVSIEAVAPAPDKAAWLVEPPLSRTGRNPVPRKAGH